MATLNGPRLVVVALGVLAEGLTPPGADRLPAPLRKLQEALAEARAWADKDGWEDGDHALALITAAADLTTAAEDKVDEIGWLNPSGMGVDLSDARDLLVQAADELEEALEDGPDADGGDL